jgi:hypothetical protein
MHKGSAGLPGLRDSHPGPIPGTKYGLVSVSVAGMEI